MVLSLFIVYLWLSVFIVVAIVAGFIDCSEILVQLVSGYCVQQILSVGNNSCQQQSLHLH